MSIGFMEFLFVTYITISFCLVLYLLTQFLYWSEIFMLFTGISFITIYIANKAFDKLGYPQYSILGNLTSTFLIMGIILCLTFLLRLIFHPRKSPV